MGRPSIIVRYTIIGMSGVYTVLLWALDLKLDNLVKQGLVALPFVGSLLLLAWDSFAVKVPLAQRFTRRPRLDGLWKGTLTPTTQSHIPAGGNRGPIDTYLVVTQSFWSIHVRQLTKESKSESRAFFWERVGTADIERLTLAYENIPKAEHQARSERHLGVCTLQPATHVPAELVGTYFTDRYTKGDMVLKLVDRSKGYATFQTARDHAQELRAKK